MRVMSIAAVFVTALVSVPAAQAPPAAELARRLQAHYDSVMSFTADFSQTYSGGLLTLTTTEYGELKLKKPGRFRMEYTHPERKTFVADGIMFYSYFPEDKTGTRDRIPDDDQASTALLFIAGQGNLTRDFIPSLAPTQPDGQWHLDLRPKTPQADFEVLTLMVDRQTLALEGFAWTDDQGGITTTRFTDLRENASIADREFEFVFPKGVIVR